MNVLTNYLEEALLNHILRGNVVGTSFAQPAVIYIGLFTVAPGEVEPGTEVTGGAYNRIQATFTAPAQQPDDAALSENTEDILYPVATADWGNITHIALFDAEIGGNMLMYGQAAIPKNIYTGDQYIIRLSDLGVKMD